VELAWLGSQITGQSEAQIYDMLRFWTMSIADFLDEYFENPPMKAYQAVGSIIGTALGPMSPGTAYVLLHHAMGDVDGNVGSWGYSRGGMGGITQALTASLRASGGEVRPVRAWRRCWSGTAARRAWCWRTATNSAHGG
jgi:phytoene dehydrogenase-like protein